MAKPNSGTDFIPDELAKKTDKHEQDISNLYNWANKMEENFGSNEKIAKTLHEVAKSSVEMNTMLKECLNELIQKDPEVNENLKLVVEKIDRAAFNALISKIGFAGWTLLVSVVSGGLVLLLIQQ